ncbi:MAG: protein kinase [Symploca sp. SIO1A3]|nr:protein kinase [Symploca sp. SIO1A3]
MTNDKQQITNNQQPNYHIERELGHNLGGGRVTYLATSIKSGQPVVVKQFQFAKVGASWSEYEAHEQEITLLQQLNSPSIPQYLDSFETPDGFCLVQEYKPAPSLATPQQFTPQEIKEIAIATLEVLVYLQQQVPPVIHRDIKPENLLIDHSPKIKVYLVDFGLARPADGDVAASSVVKGTLGFMPPEQMFNRQLTMASDLYSLGVTLICLLTQTKSTEVGNLIDEGNRINFKSLVQKGRRQNPPLTPPRRGTGGRRQEEQLSLQFINWLEKMVAPNLKHRYPNAATALAALEPIEVVGTSGSRWGENLLRGKLTQLILASLSGIALLTIGLNPINLSNSGDDLQQLLETGQCSSCDLRGVDLRDAKLQGVDLTNADLSDADLRGADLRSADLENVNLTATDLRGADLRGATLRNAILKNADYRGTNFRSADLRGTMLGIEN